MKRNFTVIAVLLILILQSGAIFCQGNVEAIKSEALKQMQYGRYGEAIDLLNKFISAKPQNPEGYNYRGLCYEKRGQLEMAVFDFRAARKIAPNNKDINNNLNRATQNWYGQLYKKIEGHKREIAINPGKAVNYLEIGKCFKNFGNWSKAEEWYDDYLKREEPSADEVIRYTEILAKTNHLEKGERILKRFVEKYPNDWRLLSRYGYFSLWLGKTKLAIELFERALAIKPFFKEALDGLDQAKGKGYNYTFFDTTGRHNAKPVEPKEYPIDKYYRMLKKGKNNDETRFLLVAELWKEKRIEEAYQQLKILSEKYSGTERYEADWKKVKDYRDSVYTEKLNDYKAKFEKDPKDKESLLKLIEYYKLLQNYDDATAAIDKYYSTVPDDNDIKIRYAYAQILAWNKDFAKAKDQMDIVLKGDPDNLDYQLFRGELSVWMAKDLDVAKGYLENVAQKRPKNIESYIALSSLNLQQLNFAAAQEYADKAKSIDPNNENISKLQANIDFQKLRAEEEKIFNILEEGRKLCVENKYPEALAKYDEYLSKAEKNRTVMIEYADVAACALQYDKSIETYNTLLTEQYDPELDFLRAKTYYWMGDTLNALNELRRIAPTRKDDFFVNLYLGDAYMKMHDYDSAGVVYDRLMATQLDSSQTEMVRQRIGWLPVTGLGSVFSSFPQYVLISPDGYYYGDNLGFSYNSQGLRVELGMLSFLTLGAQAYRSTLSSKVNTDAKIYYGQITNINTVKWSLYLRFHKYVLSGVSFGKSYYTDLVNTKKDVYDAFLNYEVPKRQGLSLYFNRLDASQVAYSPHLVGLRMNADVAKISGFVQIPSGFKISSSYTYLKISDGNRGANFELRLGKYFYPDFIAGYEFYSTVYGRYSSYYFSPTSKKNPYSSHSLWADWDIINEDPFNAAIGGKVGFIPTSNYILREIYGTISYKIGDRFVIKGRASYSSSINVVVGYGARSFSISAYWTL
jgi:tetratricopeptide (TPR) repeat protein